VSTPLSRIFEPRSIAVVGASNDPTKRGHQILRALQDSGFPGDVFPVNPRGGQILGTEVVTSVDELPYGVDLAVLCTPAAAAPQLVEAAGRRGVGAALVLAVGFGESGAAGRALEDALAEAGAGSGVRIVGPNTSGILNLTTGLNLVGARGVRAGGIALLVQSGNVALSLMTEVTERSWDGVSIYLGVGNQVDLGSEEVLGYLEGHRPTRAVIVYLESVPRGRAWLETAARVARSKPIVAIKSGRTAAGSAAALSHTGSIAGPYDRLSAGLRQAGVVEVTRTDELLHVAETLGNQASGAVDGGIAVLSDGGGQGALVTDTLVEAGATLAELAPGTRDRLRALLGPAAATGNPVDLAGASDADPMVFAEAMDVLLEDPSVASVFVVGLFGGYGVRFSETLTPRETEAAVAMAERASAARKGLVVHTMYAAHRTAPLEALGTRGVPVVGSLEVACRCVIELQRRARVLSSPRWSPDAPVEGAPSPEATAILDQARREGRVALTEPEARTLLGAYGLLFAAHAEVTSAAEAVAATARLGGATVFKLISSSVLHKSEAGGVRMGIASGEDAAAAFEGIAADVSAWCARHGLDPEPTRVMVSPMHAPPRLELLVGGARDESLGPVLTVGAGGIWVEALADVATRVLPVQDDAIRSAIAGLGVGPVLAEGRGRPEVAWEPILRAARAVLRLLELHPEVAEVELNPLFVYDDHAEPIDARVVLAC
jgi:acyl-CoA synthetase (NDP forming)